MNIGKIFLDKDKVPVFTKSIVFNYYDFKKMFMEDLNNLEKQLGWLDKSIRKIFKDNINSTSIRVKNIYAEEFLFYLSNKKVFLWEHTGGTAICSIELSNDLKIRKTQLNTIIKKTEQFSEGIVTCSMCGKNINHKENINNKHFAGIYCEICWQDKIKVMAGKKKYN